MARDEQCGLLCGGVHSRREHKLVYYAPTSEGRELLTAVTADAVVVR